MYSCFAVGCVLSGGIIVGCCWSIWVIAYRAGIRDGRQYEHAMFDQYVKGIREAKAHCPTYSPDYVGKDEERRRKNENA